MEEKTQVPVSFRRQALRSVSAISCYIEEKGYPYTAEQYARRMHKFGTSLGNFPLKHARCRNRMLSVMEFRCALFDGRYVFVYGVSEDGVEIFNVLHGAAL